MDNIGFFFLIFGLNGKIITLDNLMIFGTKYLLYITIILSFILGFMGGIKEKKALLLILFTFPIAVLLIKIIHIFWVEPRPFITYHFLPLIDNNSDASFPSRHAVVMAIIAFAYTFYKSRWAFLLLFFMLWVGFSRVYVGVHYPLDIIGGFILGMVSLLLANKVLFLIKLRLR